MTSQPIQSDLNPELNSQLQEDSERVKQRREKETKVTYCEKMSVVKTAKAQSSSQESLEDSLALPEPDAENITVLTNKLPNKPILPWNRYDSPWKGSQVSTEINPDGEANKREIWQLDQDNKNITSQEIAEEEFEPDEME